MNNTEETPTASERAMRDFEALVQTLHFPRYRELPAIELYMDQVLTYVDDQLRPLLPEGEKLLTSSMVNNYVKQKLIPVPTQKRYGREHVALLIFICLMKRSVSIADIQRLFAMQAAASSTERAYDFFCTAAEESLRSLFCGTTSARNLSEWAIEDPSGFAFSLRIAQADELSLERKMVIAAATAIANKVYLEKCLEFASL
ncbi:DUF1836 domain-containing protein [Slackia faecicanis]|uniref:DUF1836 domain-containing protein n=1 Tax=Slackia faecicanis TaxID=255723 RepID=UPI001B864FD1|nr:DUF1836 domain-containing protein [Slackia faecicanis]